MGIRILDSSDGRTMSLGYEFVGEQHLDGAPACVLFVNAAPGEGPRLHKHTYPELFFVLEGEATFRDGEREYSVSGGQTVLVPSGHPHAFTNSGRGNLRQIDVHLSPAFDTEWLED